MWALLLLLLPPASARLVQQRMTASSCLGWALMVSWQLLGFTS
jgi:hypothetical protein